MDSKEEIRPITYLKNGTADLVSEICDSGKTVLIAQNAETAIRIAEGNA